MERLRSFALAVWMLAFVGAATNHARDFAAGGLRPYAGAPLDVEVFWTSLVVLDPLVAVLILTARRAGLAVGSAVMVTDVAVNGSLALAAPGRVTSLSLLMLLSQTVFLGFVLGSVPWLWRDVGGRPERTLSPRS